MNLRERLLAHLREANYKPANEFELSGRLGLNKKQRAMLAHEVRLALKSGQFVRAANGRISPQGAKAETQRGPEKRPVFSPTRRGPGFPVTPTPETYSSRGPSVPPVSSAQPTLRGTGVSPVSSRRPGVPPVASPKSSTPSRAPAPKPAEDPKPGKGELIGRIQFRAGGSAFVVRDAVLHEDAQPALQVFPEDTGVALPGDRVLAREFPGRKGRRPGEKIGGVIRVLERDRDTLSAISEKAAANTSCSPTTRVSAMKSPSAIPRRAA